MASKTKTAHSASAVYRLAKLLKHLDNRLCADCGASLLEWQNFYGSLSHQVWLCNTCFESHVEVLGETAANGKRIKDEWTEEEVSMMEKAGSNVQRNKVYERYHHPDWKKITPESPYTERIQYIKAKYQSMYFTIPPLAATTVGGKKPGSHSAGHSTTLPMRTADYFVTLGPGRAKGRAAGKSVTDMTFNVEVLSTFPNEHFYKDQPSPLPELLGPMVFPKGLRMSKREERPYCFTFVLTDTYRVKQFGTVLVVHELVDPRTLQGLLAQRRPSITGRDSVALRDGALHTQSANQLDDEVSVVYAPKALVVLSHYPFFHLFTRFLEQIYHLSLSSSPLPIERYIANFMLELPLPPQGRIEVVFSLPESQLQISRPPRNQLPMVDFSYRPLFAYLSVDNILAIFACLCQEMSICICAKNIALLTPVQEALLSLLFPFVWQGCYVPVLPADMAELLHAPVPLLTGMLVDDISESFLDDDPSMRPAGLVIVHLESDTIHYGSECNPLPLPKAMLPKLRQKLVEHGAAIHQLPEEMVLLSNAELLYPNDEHMRPMKHFIAAQGVLSNLRGASGPATAPAVRRGSNLGGGAGSGNSRFNSNDLADDASETSTVTGSVAGSVAKRGGLLRGLYGGSSAAPPKPPKDQKFQHVSASHHPACCTFDASARLQANSAYFATRRYALDPAYNYQPDVGQYHQLPASAIDFNAMEVRGAFLRFFVAAFLNYEEFFSDYAIRQKERDAAEKSSKRSPFGGSNGASKSVDGGKYATLTKQSLDSTSRPKEVEDRSFSMTADGNGARGVVAAAAAALGLERRNFDQKKFTAAQEDAFLKHMISSQMFANFISEIIEEPDQPEIRFFNEHIIAKRNRSKLSLTKGSTPFLDDTSENISQSFTVPGPVTASVPLGQAFSYTAAFPLPDIRQMQIVVSERGLAASGGAGGYLVREIGMGPETSRLQRGESPQVMRDRVRLQFGPNLQGLTLPTTANVKGASLNTLRRTLVGLGGHDTDDSARDTDEDEEAENSFFLAARRRYDGVLRGMVRFQAGCRARHARRIFGRQRRARRIIQRWWSRNRLRQVIKRRIRAKAVRRLAGVMRFLLCRRRFKRNLQRVRVLQSVFRAHRWRALFLAKRRLCQRLQAWYRGVQARLALRKQWQTQWGHWRRQLLYLWTADCTSLAYRSSFWTTLVDHNSFVIQALHQQELRRLYDNFALTGGSAGAGKTNNFAEHFRTSLNAPMVLKLSALHTSQQTTAAEIGAQTNAIVDEALRGSPKLPQVQERRRALTAERKNLYLALRDDRHNDELFRLFGLQDLKKRKQKLSDLVWVCCNDDYAAKSAKAVVAILSGTIPDSASSKVLPKNCVTEAARAPVSPEGTVDWPAELLRRRVAADCAEAARALLTAADRRSQSRGQHSATPFSARSKVSTAKAAGTFKQ